MVTFTLSFALGVWLLQQQAALPLFGFAWLLAGIPLALAIRTESMPSKILKILLIAAFACAAGFYDAALQAKNRLSAELPADWQGRDIELVGVVAKLPRNVERGQRFAFDVEKTLTAGVELPAHLYLSTYPDTPSPALHAAERWRLTVRLKRIHGSSNPHAFDFELWALENNVRATGYVRNDQHNKLVDRRAHGLLYLIETWREAVRDKFDEVLGPAPYTGVLTALSVGDQGSIPRAQWQVFARTGVIHLMSISGLHITMLSGIGFAIAYRLWRRSARLTLRLPARKAAALAALLVAAGYTLLSGYGVPAQRTLYMVASVAIALWLNRSFSLSQILCIALLGVLLLDPWAVLAPGFWLSFGAVALIFFVSAHRIGPAETGRGSWPKRVLTEYATVQWAMSIGLTPLLLGLFGQVSLISPVANAIAIPLISIVVVPLALLGAALPTEVPLWLAHMSMEAAMRMLEFLSRLPQSVWIQHAPSAASIALGACGAVWMLAPAGFASRWLGLLMMLPMFLNGPAPPEPASLRMIVFDVGQGLSAAMQTRHHALLYDTGPDYSGDADSGNRIIVPALRGMGIAKLDGVILSHDDIDHTGGTASLLDAIPTGWIASSRDSMKTVSANAGHIVRCRDGQSWEWGGVLFEMLNPSADSRGIKAHDNDAGCVLRIGTGDRHILLTADIERRGEARLLHIHPEQLAADLLVVPHHGSSSSSHLDFIAAVLPDYAVFTNGYRNRFGHPKPEVLQRYLDSGAVPLRSDKDGAILIEMSGRELHVERYRTIHRRYWMDAD